VATEPKTLGACVCGHERADHEQKVVAWHANYDWRESCFECDCPDYKEAADGE
jgi:hypothetical protein